MTESIIIEVIGQRTEGVDAVQHILVEVERRREVMGSRLPLTDADYIKLVREAGQHLGYRYVGMTVQNRLRFLAARV